MTGNRQTIYNTCNFKVPIMTYSENSILYLYIIIKSSHQKKPVKTAQNIRKNII